MYDGKTKPIEHINKGDLVMGLDSQPKAVLDTIVIYEDVYEVTPVKGDKYNIGASSKICLTPTNLGIETRTDCKSKPYVAVMIDSEKIKKKSKYFATKEEAQAFLNIEMDKNKHININIDKYIRYVSKSAKREIKLYRSDGLAFDKTELRIDPYLLGVWLGDGDSDKPNFTTQDSRMYVYLAKHAASLGMHLTFIGNYHYRFEVARGPNKIKEDLIYYKLIKNKHVPDVYKFTDMDTRRKVLAGLIDTDGYYNNNCYEIIQKSKVISDDIVFIARSLGFAAYQKPCNKSCMHKGIKFTGLYYRVYFSGEDVENLPVILERKKAHERQQKKNVRVTGVQEIKPIGNQECFGISIQGDGRCLLQDFTVVHVTI
jgi:hypothetical protein